MAILDSLQASVSALLASNDKVLAETGQLKTDLAAVNVQLAALTGSSTLTPADQAVLDGIIQSIAAETQKNASA